MKILLCGGSGFVGQNVHRRLNAEGHECIIYDKAMPPSGHGVFANIHDFETLKFYMERCDLVFHLASNADISVSAENPSIDFDEGTVLTKNILEAMRLTRTPRLIYFSGSGVYGDYPMKAFHEEDPILPVSTYGASKAASEALICAYCHMFGIEARVFRPANIVGKGQTHGVALDFVRRLQKEPTSLRILGDGYQTKSYIHVDDVLDAVWLAMKNWNPAYDVFNIASRDAISVRQIAKIAFSCMGISEPDLQFSGGPRGWNGDVARINLNCSKLESMGWIPSLDSKSAVASAIFSML